MNYAINPTRWHLKKCARRAVTHLSVGLARNGQNAKRPTIHVLTYHRFTGLKYDPVSVKPRDFEKHLQWLGQNVQLLDAEAFCLALQGKQQSKRDAVLITIDDGHRSFYDHAYPLLKKYNAPAILFVCPSLINSKHNSGEFMNWEELEQVQRDRIIVASHGLSHRSLGKISIQEAEYEVKEAQKQLKQHLKIENPFFAFPFGTRKDFSDPLADMLLDHGYLHCFTSIHGACVPLSRSNLLPRIKIESGESIDMFSKISRGHLDAWRAVDNVAWWLQQRGRL